MTHATLSFDDLVLTAADIYAQMGYGSATPDEQTQQETKALMDDVRCWLQPQFCFFVSRELPAFHLGRIIENQLRGSEAYACLICTAGTTFEDWQQRLKAEGDMVRIFIADALGSVIAEKCADRMEDSLQQSIDKLGWHHTNRFSPGYCGWHVAEQQLLFPAFSDTCGVRLTASSLMVPIKSVSGIIGLGKTVRRMEYTCGLCDMKQCYKRKGLKQAISKQQASS